MKETTYYQAAPPRLRSIVIAAPIYLVFCALAAILARALLGAFYIGFFYLAATCGAVVLVVLAYNLLIAAASKRPMLILNSTHLIFRKVRIPWDAISQIRTIKTPAGSRVGIVLCTATVRVGSRSVGRAPLLAVEYLLQQDIKRFGAIIIPNTRGVSVEDLQHVITDYHRLATRSAPQA